jgi:hypothetical protein
MRQSFQPPYSQLQGIVCFEEGAEVSPIAPVINCQPSFSQWSLLIDCPLYRLGLVHLEFEIEVLRLILGLLNF